MWWSYQINQPSINHQSTRGHTIKKDLEPKAPSKGGWWNSISSAEPDLSYKYLVPDQNIVVFTQE